jgi:hypothetical protein
VAVQQVSVSWNVDVELYGFPHAAGPELDRLIKGPAGSTVVAMEAALAAGFLETEAWVHVITGYLRASGHVQSHFTGEEWEGEIDYARYPGIFELARGNTPTGIHPDPNPGGAGLTFRRGPAHPDGGHYFFDPGGPDFERGVRQAVWDFVTDDEGGLAPSEGLGPWSGGGA